MLSVDDGVVHLSASDLVGHLNCRYLTKLDLAVARGELNSQSHYLREYALSELIRLPFWSGYGHQEALDGKFVEWMEYVSDEQYRA
jgi:hypothetical protein